MLSGIWPRGNSSAPGSGNTGITSGSSPGPSYSALIGICVPLLARFRAKWIPVRVTKTRQKKNRTRNSSSRCAYSSQNRYPLLRNTRLGEQDRRQSLASLDGGLVRRAPGLEELHQLLARAVLVPFA